MNALRVRMKIEAIQTASSMVESIHEGGMDRYDLNMTEEEFYVFISECSKLSKKLDKESEKLLNKYSKILTE